MIAPGLTTRIVRRDSTVQEERTAPLDQVRAAEPDRTLTVDERLSVVEQSATLVNRAWILHHDANELRAEIVDGHAELEATELERKAQDRVREGLPALLGELADHGLAWVDIAALAGVSVPAVRKWRTGGAASGEKLLELARLAVLLSWLHDDNVIADVASWLEVPLASNAPLTRMDLLKHGDHDLVIRSLVGEGLSPHEILDEYQPDWRTAYQSDFEVFIAEDGQRSIRSK
ncbi:MAG: hypoxia/intracellular survival transcriptional regulator MosR [Acidimicrobiales bacterium]